MVNFKITLGAIIGVIVVVGLIVAGFLLLPEQEPIPQSVITGCPGGATVLSISDARITTSSDLNGKEVIRVVAVANGGGECLTIGWSKSELEEELGEDFTVDNGVFGSLTTQSQIQTFTSSQNQEPVFKVIFNPKQQGTFCTQSNCQQTYDNIIGACRENGLFGGTCQCISTSLIGSGGQMDSGLQRDFEVDFSIDNLGSIILTDSQQSGKISSLAFIKWSGDLMSNNWLGRPNYDSFLRVSDNRWNLAQDGFFNDITDRFETDESDLRCSGEVFSDVRNDIASYNAFVDLKIANKDSEFESRESLVKTADWNGNKLSADLATFTTWQVFTIDLDAEWVGIHKNIGQPDVRCPSGRQEFVSGSRATTVVEVRDTSGTNPSFNLAYDCTAGSGSITQSRINNVGSSFRDLEVFATITTTQERDFSCTFTASDLNEPDNKDSCSVDYRAKPFTGCTSGEKQCSSDGKKLLTCNQNGDGFNEVPCDFGCEAFEDTFRCKLQANEICDDGIDNDGDGLIDLEDPNCEGEECGAWIEIGDTTIIPDLFCIINNAIEKFKMGFAIAVGILGAIMGGLFARRFVENKSGKTQTITILITAVIVGVLLGILAFIFFYIAIILLILAIIIKIFV